MQEKTTLKHTEGFSFYMAILSVIGMPIAPEYGAPPLALAAFFFAFLDARRKGGLRIGMLGKLLLLYIAYSAIGIFYSAHRGNSLATVAMWVVMFLLYLTLTTVLTSRRRIQITLFLFSAAVGLVGLISCAQYGFRNILNIESIPEQFWAKFDRIFFRYFPMTVDLEASAGRVCGTFNNPNMLAEFFIMVVPLVGYYGFHGKRTPSHLLGRCFTLLAVFGAVVSLSRGAYIALLAMLLLLVVTHIRKLSPFAMCLIAAVSLVPEAVITRFLSIGESDHSILERFDVWGVAIQSIIKNPLFGTGPGVSNFWEFLTEMGVSAPHSHNLVLQLLIEGGFIGLFLMFLVGTRLLQDSMGLIGRSRQTASIGLTFLLFAVAFVMHGMVDFPFLSPKLVGTFCIMLGFFDALSAPYLTDRLTPLSRVLHPVFRWVKAVPSLLKKKQ